MPQYRINMTRTVRHTGWGIIEADSLGDAEDKAGNYADDIEYGKQDAEEWELDDEEVVVDEVFEDE